MNKIITALGILTTSFVLLNCSSTPSKPQAKEEVCKKTLLPNNPGERKPSDFYFGRSPAFQQSAQGDHLLAYQTWPKGNFSIWSLPEAKGLHVYRSPKQYAVNNAPGVRLRGSPEFAGLSASGAFVAFSYLDPNGVTCTDIYKGDNVIGSISGYGAGFAGENLIVLAPNAVHIFDTAAASLSANILKEPKNILYPHFGAKWSFGQYKDLAISKDEAYLLRVTFVSNGKSYELGLETVDLTTGEYKDHAIEEPQMISSLYTRPIDFEISGGELRGLFLFGQGSGHEYHVMSYNLKTGETSAARVDLWDASKRIRGEGFFEFDRTYLLSNDVLVVDSKTGKSIERLKIAPKEMMAYTHGADFFALGKGKFIKMFSWAFDKAHNPIEIFDITQEKVVATLPLALLSVAPATKPEPAKVAPPKSPAELKRQAFIDFIHRYGPNPESLSAYHYDVGVYCQYGGPRCSGYRKMYQNLEREYNRRAEAANMQRIWDYTRGDRSKAGATSDERIRCLQRLTESINRHTYGKQDWHFDLNSCN